MKVQLQMAWKERVFLVTVGAWKCLRSELRVGKISNLGKWGSGLRFPITMDRSNYRAKNETIYISYMRFPNMLVRCRLIYALSRVQEYQFSLTMHSGNAVQSDGIASAEVLTFRAVNRTAPNYIKSLLQPYTPNRHLRSSSDNRLVVPQYKNNLMCFYSFIGIRCCSNRI